VRLRPSGLWAIEIKRRGDRLWLGAFETPKLAARVFDMVVWRLDGPRGLLNFHEVESHNEEDRAIRREYNDEDRAIRREYMQMGVRQSDRRPWRCTEPRTRSTSRWSWSTTCSWLRNKPP
jgi:hypothetical protein